MIRTFCAAAALTTAFAAPAHADFTLNILHTNDFHSRIESINKYDSSCNAEGEAEGKCFGGSARLATAIRDRRAALGEDTLLLDGGDQFQGSLYYSYYKGKVAAEMMNRLGYDAMTVGNHEFDDGPEVLAGFVDAIDFPILLANAEVGADAHLAGKLKGVHVITRGDEQIGLIGIATEDTPELSSPGDDVAFRDAIAVLRGAVSALEAAGVNKIVVMSHSGYNRDLEIAAHVSGVDVIVGGHSNTYLANDDEKAAGPYPTMATGPDGGQTAIVQAYAYGKYLGELAVTFDDAGAITAATGAPMVMGADVAVDQTINQRIAELAAPLDEIRNEVVAEAAAPIDGDRANCRATVCEMGVMVAEAMLDRVRGQGVDMVITNGGGLRASIDAGPVTMGEVLTVLPFKNTLATFELSGADVLTALENGVSQVEDGGGRFPQVAGLKFAWTPAKPAGERIISAEVMGEDGWTSLDPEATYGVASNNFMRSGGDGYDVFETSGMNAYDYGPGLEVVFADWLAAQGPVTPMVDDRIRRVE